MVEDRSLSEIILEETTTAKDFSYYKRLVFFEEELSLIFDINIRKFVEYIMNNADPFWSSPATLIPAQHPLDEYDTNGMAIHTKRVVKTVAIMLSGFDCTTTEKDCVLAAAFLHDITKAVWKNQEENEVAHDDFHPYTVESFVKWCQSEECSQTLDIKVLFELLSNDDIDMILRLIRCSHGPWSIVPETVPTTFFEKLLHMADLVASNLDLVVRSENLDG